MMNTEGSEVMAVPTSRGGAEGRGRTSLRQIQKEMTRDRIIKSALRVFAQKSFTTATLEDIAATGLVSRPTIYAHFDSKGSILRAAIDQLPDFDPLLNSIVEAKDHEARYLAFRGLSDFWHDHLSDVWKYVREAASVDPQIMEWVESFAVAHTLEIKTCLQKHGIPEDVAHGRAFLIWCSWHEYIFWINRSCFKPSREVMISSLTHAFESALGIGGVGTSRS